MCHAVNMLKKLPLHATSLTKIFSIINPVAIPPIPKVVGGFSYIFFTIIFRRQKINETVLFTIKFMIYHTCLTSNTADKTYSAQKMKFSIKDFFSKCVENQIWSHLMKKSLMENFTFCAV